MTSSLGPNVLLTSCSKSIVEVRVARMSKHSGSQTHTVMNSPRSAALQSAEVPCPHAAVSVVTSETGADTVSDQSSGMWLIAQNRPHLISTSTPAIRSPSASGTAGNDTVRYGGSTAERWCPETAHPARASSAMKRVSRILGLTTIRRPNAICKASALCFVSDRELRVDSWRDPPWSQAVELSMVISARDLIRSGYCCLLPSGGAAPLMIRRAGHRGRRDWGRGCSDAVSSEVGPYSSSAGRMAAISRSARSRRAC